MSVINLNSEYVWKSWTYEERRVQAIRRVLVENTASFEDAGWAIDADRFAVWLERTQWFVSSSATNASFHNVPFGAEPSEGALDFNKPDSILVGALRLVEEEQESFRGEFDSCADFVEESWYEAHGEQAVPDDLKWVIDWQKLWDGSWSYDHLDIAIYDTDGKYRHFFWSNE